jgi:hypothetical protein
LGKKFYNSLNIGPHFFLQHLKTKIICNFVKFVVTQKVMTTNFFSPLSLVAIFGSGIRDPGSGIRDQRSEIRDQRSGIRDQRSGMSKNQDPGSGINIPDPQH